MKIGRFQRAGAERSGKATILALIALLVLAGLAGVVMVLTERHTANVAEIVDQNRAYFLAQAGVHDALLRVQAGDVRALGSAKEPIAFAGGSYWVALEGSGGEEGALRLTASGSAGGEDEMLEVVVAPSSVGAFRNAIFAGNSAGDADYVLALDGAGPEARRIRGDVYSGGGVALSAGAEVAGRIQAMHAETGTAASDAVQVPPDLARMRYAATADVKVAAEFATGGASYRSAAAGGKAWQLPRASPAHVFRKNPSDRLAETGGTVKDDYFLEDPYEAVGATTRITLAGISGEPGESSNRKVFFVDGNLWIHNHAVASFELAHDNSSGVQVTFVVAGNIYFSAGFAYADPGSDGVAFFAVKDPAVPDSGNVYLGDSASGKPVRVHGYLYAENDLRVVHPDVAVELLGSAAAGNHVELGRARLVIDHDERLAEGALELPGLPDGASFRILSWREVDPE